MKQSGYHYPNCNTLDFLGFPREIPAHTKRTKVDHVKSIPNFEYNAPSLSSLHHWKPLIFCFLLS